ncbi:MAG: hypothetical protein AB8B55_23285 [Mariniblastus sp.]
MIKKDSDPFKDAEVNPEAPKLDLSIIGGLAVGFLWFHRKVFIGIALLVGLGLWLYQTSLTKSENEERQVARTVRRKTDLESDTTKAIQDPLDGVSAKIEIPKANIGLAKSADDENPNTKPSSGKLQRFLETASVEELVEKSLSLREESKKVNPTLAFVIFSERLKIARRLMEMETSDTERFYAINSYIESVSILDSLNIEDKLNILGTGAAIEEVDQTFSNHRNPAIAAKANLTVLIRPVYMCLASRDVDMLEVFKDGFDERMESILVDPTSARRLAEVTNLLVERLYGEEEETVALAKHILNFYEQREDPEIKKIAAAFREKLYFGRFDLRTILERIEIDDQETRDDIQGFFLALAENPDSRTELVQLAFTSIQVYYGCGKTNDAKALLKWYLEIVDTMSDQERKVKILEAVNNWKLSVGL